jgi:acyl carrier protein
MDTQAQMDPAAVEQQVLDIVRELLRDGGRESDAASVSPTSHFERDLGMASLELVELMVRCEARFEVELPEHMADEAETPAGWVKAILEGGRDAETKAAYRISPPRLDALTEPTSAASLIDVLARHAEADPGRVHIHLLEKDSGQGITYGQLYEEAAAVAAGLAEMGLRRYDTVAIMLPSGADFFYAFFGVMLAGGIPVPIYPPTRPDRIEDYVRSQIQALGGAGIRFMLSFAEVRAVVQILRVNLPSLVDVTTVRELRKAKGRLGIGSVKPAENAVLQFTSGSTGAPKAVALSHAAVLSNIRAIGAAVEVRPGDALVSWLPLYSDLGLIGNWLFSLYYAAPITILSPVDFLKRPERWLHAIRDSRGSLASAPNFAYELCTRRIPAWTLEGVDLSSWRVAVNAGEPVLPETVTRFSERFAPYGFRPGAMLPCFGLAESSVALAIPPAGRLPVRDRILRRELETAGKALAAPSDDTSALSFFSSGMPVEGQQIRLVDDHGNDVPDRTIGRLLFRGDSTMSGYYRNPEATAAVLVDQDWIDTGDYGYLADGEFFFTGRVQDTIAKAGRQLNPLDVEIAVGNVPGVIPGSAVAFGAPEKESGADRLMVAVETGASSFEDFRRIETEIVRVVDKYLGMPPDGVRILAPGCLPRTQNGKVRRNEIRSLFLRGKLRAVSRAPWLQIVRLRRENLGALIGLGVRRIRVVGGRAATNFAAGFVARVAGLWARVSGSNRIVRSACRRVLELHAQRFSLQGAELLPGKTPLVLVANRSGLFDPLVMVATLPSKVWFADRAALNDLPPSLAYLLKPLVLGDRDGQTVPVAGSVRGRVLTALESQCIVVNFPESPVGEPVARNRYRLDVFQAAAEMGVEIRPAAVRERAVQQQPVEWARVRRVTMVILRDPIAPPEDNDCVGLRHLVREAIGDYHA